MRILLAWLFLLGLACGVARAQSTSDGPQSTSDGPSYQQLLDSARLAAGESRFRDAVRDLEAAYALRQDPTLLLELGRGYRRLGDHARMVDYYTRYRIAAPSLTPEIKAELDAAVPPPPSAIVAPQLPPQPAELKLVNVVRPHRGMRIAGAMLFGFAYGAATIAGGDAILNGGPEYRTGNSATAGGLLFIPFIGPFASAAAFRDPRWVGPWVAVDGVAQLLGLGLMIASHYRKETVKTLVPIHLSPYASTDGAGLITRLDF